MMKLNYIYKFDFDYLFNSKKENGILKCSSVRCDMARKLISKRDSLLFDQIKKCKSNNISFEEVLVILDFSKFIEHRHSMEELKDINEIELKVRKVIDIEGVFVESEKEITIRVVDFLKSNSMSKDCQVYYINYEVLDNNGNNLYESLLPRIFFDFHKQETVLSKLYAYSGTLCSDCTLLDDIKFNEDEILVVDDSNYIFTSNCITMISVEYIVDKIKKVKEYVNNYKDKTLAEILKFNACLELESIKNSLSLPENADKNYSKIQLVIDEFFNISKESIEKFKQGLGAIIEHYSNLGSSNDEVEWISLVAKDYPFDLNLYDGEGLISKEFCQELVNSLCDKLGHNKYKNSTSFQIRMPYIKGMVHSCDIKGFFKEKGVTFVEHTILCGEKKYNIDQVKMIITKSQFKAEGFIDASEVVKTIQDYLNLINKYDYPFGVIDANKKDKDTCYLEYQFISTLPLSTADIRDLYLSNKWFINDSCSKDNIIEQLKNDSNPIAQKELEIYNLHPNFYVHTKKYKIRKNDIYKKLKNKAVFSKFMVHGHRRYLSGDLLGLLYHIAFYKDYDEYKNKDININTYYMPGVNESELNNSVFLRSPHYSRNEIVMLGYDNDSVNQERDKYFSHLDGVVMINPISLSAERLGGADYDGDTVLVVNDYIVVNCVKNKLFEKNDKLHHKYLPCKIPSLKGKKMNYLNYEQRLICFQNTFSSRVGQLSNSGFIDATHIYGNENSVDNNHNKIAEYTILSGLEIDSAKSGKKPKMDNKLKGEYEDEDYSQFLKAKKEYENIGSLKVKNELVSKITERVTFVLGYDNRIDEDMDIKDDYSNNVLNILYNMNEIKCFNKEQEKKPKKVNEPTNLVKALAIAKAYNDANKVLRNVISKKAKLSKYKLLNRLYEQIEEICRTKNVDFEYLINSLDIDNIEAYAKLSEYIVEDKFHYLTDIDERKTYIRLLLPELNEDVVEILCLFEQDGFRLLFMLLSLKSNKIERIELKSSNMKELDNKIDYLSDEQMIEFNQYYDLLLKQITKICNENITCTQEQLKDKINLLLINEARDLKFKDVCYSINIYESNMIYDVYFDMLKKVLMKRGNKNA